jgi:NADPH:quinone reductase-like Zn-dependent oxidoreductase
MVNAADLYSLCGKPGSHGPPWVAAAQQQILGLHTVGQVEAVSSGVTRVRPGDEVDANLLAHGYGGFAEYVSVPVKVLSLKPANLSFEEAAAVPMAGVTALQQSVGGGGSASTGCWPASRCIAGSTVPASSRPPTTGRGGAPKRSAGLRIS